MRTRTWCVPVVLVLTWTSAAAQTVVTEAEALARMSADSPRARAIRAGVELARAQALAAGRVPNPRVSLTRESVAGVTEHITTITQSLPITGRRGLAIAAANASAEAVAARVDEQSRLLRVELRQAFASLRAAQAREAAFESARVRVTDVAVTLARREQAGDAAGYDRLRAEREAADLESEWVAARVDRIRAQGQLASFFGSASDPAMLVAADEQTTAPVPDVDALIAIAERERADLVALTREVEAARLSERAARRSVMPEPEVVAGAKSADVGDTGLVLGVHLSVPLFDRARPEATVARARRAQAEAALAAERLAIRASVAALRAIVTERRDAARRHREALAAGADQLERIALVSYDAGERGILELLDAYRSAAAARVRQSALDAAAREVELELALVSGWEMGR